MAIPLPPAPNAAAPGDFVWVDWYNKLQKILSVTGSIAWNLIDFKSSKLTDIVNRDHNDLLAIQGGTATEHYHLNNAQYVIATQAASATLSGYLTSADWSTFNSKGAGTVISVTGTAPVVSSGGTTPVISMVAATASVNGYLTSADWSTFNGKQPAGAYLTAVTSNSPLTGAGTAASHLSMPAATTSVNGYLTSTDWTTFNNKQPAGTYVTSVAGTTGRITSSGGTTPAIDLASGIATAGTTGSSTLIPVVTIDTYGRVTSITTASNPQGTVTSVSGTAPVVSSGGTTPAISMAAATTSVSGYLTSTDWNTFNNKGSGTVTSVTGTSPVVSSGGATPAISMAAATTSVSGYLTSTDWNTFNGKQAAGTYVTSLTVTGSNGFAGSFTSGATPALTVSTSITGLLKGNGTAISAAVANTDYVPLSTVLTKTADYTIANTDMWIINNKTGSALTLTFPAASSWTGRAITVKNMQAQLVNSASSNIVPIDSTTAGTAILLGVVGNWAKLVSDGTNWVIMQAASNNNLLLE